MEGWRVTRGWGVARVAARLKGGVAEQRQNVLVPAAREQCHLPCGLGLTNAASLELLDSDRPRARQRGQPLHAEDVAEAALCEVDRLPSQLVRRQLEGWAEHALGRAMTHGLG